MLTKLVVTIEGFRDASVLAPSLEEENNSTMGPVCSNNSTMGPVVSIILLWVR